ncbi:MAG: 6-pyruvoyl trahydropterin synthase family protein [Acidimicrobiia bacterium]
MFEVGVVKRFHASHSLEGEFGPATKMHSHYYRVEVIVRGTRLNADGTLVDISILSNAADKAIGELDGRSLNEVEPFDSTNSTAEAVSKALAGKVAAEISDGGLETLLVKVWESDEAFASYECKI